MTLLNEKSAWDLTEKGNDYLKSGKYKKAIKYYDQALKIEPGYITALCGKGALESFFNHKNEAIVLFETALRINPEYTPALTKLAWNYNSVKRYDDAINCCNTALEIDPASAESWSIKGYAFYKLAKYSASLNCCHIAKGIDSARVHLFEKDAIEKKSKEEETIKNIQLKEDILKEIQSIKSEGFESKIVKIWTALENPEKIFQAKKDLDEMKIEIREKEKNERNLLEKENTDRKTAVNSLNDLQTERERLIHKGVVFSVDLELLSDLINKKCFEEMVEKAREINDYLKLRENDYNSVMKEIRRISSIPSGLQDLLNSGKYQEALQFLTLQKKVIIHVERELSNIHTAGFEKEVNNLYKMIDDPAGIFSVENDLISLKEQIREREIRQDVEKTLSRVQNLTESLQNDGLILNNDIFSRISLINERICKKQYELAQKETSSLESDLSEYKSLYDKATQLIQTVNSDQIRQLYSKGEYQKTIEYCYSLYPLQM